MIELNTDKYLRLVVCKNEVYWSFTCFSFLKEGSMKMHEKPSSINGKSCKLLTRDVESAKVSSASNMLC